MMSVTLPFPRMTYTQAVDKLNSIGHTLSSGQDLSGDHEKALGESINGPFFVTHYPREIKFFNMKSDPTDANKVLSCDLLVPGYGEIVGASEREDDHDILQMKLNRFALDRFADGEKRISDLNALGIRSPEDLEQAFDWYLDLRKSRGVPHAGFGLGFERLVQWVCGLNSIMDATEYPKNAWYLAP